jgi:ubiquinone/menaquinone biosynthesis C-methylase UbiE
MTALIADRPQENPVRSRINAAFFDVMDWYMHWKYAGLKSRLFGDLTPALVELGAGAGANFRYFRRGTRVIAVEPNRHMHEKLAKRAKRWSVHAEVVSDAAESLPLASSSVDTVVCSLVLCTVRDPAAVVREVLRILKPGGRFICVEHVAAPPTSLIGRIQRWVFRSWRWFFEGCHTHRDTAQVLAGAGFAEVEVRPFVWRSAFLPVRPQIAAMCRK